MHTSQTSRKPHKEPCIMRQLIDVNDPGITTGCVCEMKKRLTGKAIHSLALQAGK